MVSISFIPAISSCYPQQGVASNENLMGNNNMQNLFMRQQAARGQHQGLGSRYTLIDINTKWQGVVQKLRGQDEVGRWSVKCP